MNLGLRCEEALYLRDLIFQDVGSYGTEKIKKLYGAAKFNYAANMMKENFVHFHVGENPAGPNIGIRKYKFKCPYCPSNKLEVVDLNAITLCQSNKINLIIFNMDEKNAIIDVVKGKKLGTFVGEEKENG